MKYDEETLKQTRDRYEIKLRTAEIKHEQNLQRLKMIMICLIFLKVVIH